MFDINITGKFFIFIGLIFIIIGLIITFKPLFFSWFGNLPGDIKINKKNVKIFFPVISLLIITIILNLIIYIIKNLLK